MNARRIFLIPPILENICHYLYFNDAINFRSALELTHLKYVFRIVKLPQSGEYWEKGWDQLIFKGISDTTLELHRLLRKYGFNGALRIIIYREDVQSLKLLLQVDYGVEFLVRCFIVTAKRGIISLLPVFLKSNCSNILNSVWKRSRSALHQAANNNQLEVVKFLLEAGAEVDPPDDFDKTPLFLASQKGHFEIVKILLDAGANPTQQVFENGISSDPLIIAAINNHWTIVKLLLATGKIKKFSITLAMSYCTDSHQDFWDTMSIFDQYEVYSEKY